jgi:hypothetical protein
MIDTEAGSHRLHRLALPVQHQPAQIPHSGLTLIHPRQPREHPRRKILQPFSNPHQPSLIHTRQPSTIPKRLQATHRNKLTKSY